MALENRDPRGLSRRRLAITGGTILGGTILGGVVFGIMTRPAAPLTAVQPVPDSTAGVEGFLALSSILTNRVDLDARMGARLYAALAAEDGDFGEQARALAAYAQAHATMSVAALAAVLHLRAPSLADVLRRIVGAWYLGTVGAGPAARVISYEGALMFESVRDTLAPPSSRCGAPGYWIAKPPPV